MNNYFLIISILIFSCTACKRVKEPVYLSTENFRLSSIGISESVVSADIKLYNPNQRPIQIKSGIIDIFVQGKSLGKVTIDSLLTLRPTDTTAIPIRTRIAMKDFLNNVNTLMTKDSVTIKLNGTIKAGMSGHYKNVIIQYQGKQSTANLMKGTLK